MARPNKSGISKLTNDINNKKSEHKCSDFNPSSNSKNQKTRKSFFINELRDNFVVPPGIEPGTQGFSVLCSTN